MDSTKDKLDEQMEELRQALKELKTEEVTNPGAVSGTIVPKDTITLSNLNNTYSNTVIGGGYTLNLSNAAPYYTTGSVTGINWSASATASNWANPITTTSVGKLNLEGDDADILINGVSLMEVLKDRLNVMIPNPEIEKEWAELKELGDKYRKLEKDIKEKAAMWAALKAEDR